MLKEWIDEWVNSTIQEHGLNIGCVGERRILSRIGKKKKGQITEGLVFSFENPRLYLLYNGEPMKVLTRFGVGQILF